MAATLYREGRSAFGLQWNSFLIAANDLLRAKADPDVQAAAGAVLRILDTMHLNAMHCDTADDTLAGILELLRRSVPHALASRSRTPGGRGVMSLIDPLVPAILAAVDYWGSGGRPVAIIHDQQNILSRGRTAQILALFQGPHGGAALGKPSGGRLESLRLADSGADARIQVADILAGVARKIATDQLVGRGDAELTTLIRPYVDASSIWDTTAVGNN
jgi:hypothetical protein